MNVSAPNLRRLHVLSIAGGIQMAMALCLSVLAAGSSPTASALRPGTASRSRKLSPEQPCALDLQGNPVDPFKAGASQAIVLVFVRNDCPISNRYAPEIQRLQGLFVPKGVKFWLVHPDAEESAESASQHAKEYHVECAVLRDPNHTLVKRARASVTPEVAVFTPSGTLVYHGRIDDRYVSVGRERLVPTQHDLEAALQAVITGKPVALPETRAVGCYISDVQ